MAALRRAGSGIAASNLRRTIGGTTFLPKVDRRRSIGRADERRRSPRPGGHEGSADAPLSSSTDMAALGRVDTSSSHAAASSASPTRGGGEALFWRAAATAAASGAPARELPWAEPEVAERSRDCSRERSRRLVARPLFSLGGREPGRERCECGTSVTQSSSRRSSSRKPLTVEHEQRALTNERGGHLSRRLLLSLGREDNKEEADGCRAFTAEIGGGGEPNEGHDGPREEVHVGHEHLEGLLLCVGPKDDVAIRVQLRLARSGGGARRADPSRRQSESRAREQDVLCAPKVTPREGACLHEVIEDEGHRREKGGGLRVQQHVVAAQPL
eukprot:6065572-Prymnesium_polylepis.2